MAEVAVAVAWLAVVLRAPGTWRSTGSPARRALWLALLSLALGWTLRVPAGYHALDNLTGVANLSQLIGDGFALGTGCAILAMLIFQTNDREGADRKVVLRVVALILVLVAMAVSFAAARFGEETTEFVTRYRTEPLFFAYSLPYLGLLSYVFFDLTRLCRRYAQLSDRRYLKTGMRLIQAAGALGILYVVLRVGYLVAVQAGAAGLGVYEPVSKLVVAVLSVLAIVGAVLPAAGPRVEAYRAHRELYPLWSELHRATPSIALDRPTSSARDRLRLRDLSFRLHRRVIEIRDGQLALRPYLRRDVAEAARRRGQQQQLAGEELAASVEAATLVAAIDDKSSGRPEVPRSATVQAPGGAKLSDEVSWLRKVAHSFQRRQDREGSRHA